MTTTAKADTLPLVVLDLERYPAYPDEVLQGRYRILRKLGNGHHSDTWLVLDTKEFTATDGSRTAQFGVKYLAVKILTLDATLRHSTNQVREHHFLRLVSSQISEKSWGLPVLLDSFHLPGSNGAESHLCFVMYVFGSSISKLRRSSPNKALPVHTVKAVVAQLVDCIAQLHKLGIIHAGIKPENVLINSTKSDEEIERYLQDPPDIEGVFERPAPQANPVAGTGGGASNPGVVRHPYLGVQPLPLPISWDGSPKEAELVTITLVDFGKSQEAGAQPTLRHFAPLALRTPEEILGSYFGPKVDIWAIGCITFELLTGRWLFHPEGGQTWRVDDDHLAKMLELTGDTFSPQMLDFSQDAEQFFDEEGNLQRIPDLMLVPMENAISVYNVVPDEEVKPAADFIRSCLRLDPLKRPGASELEKHPWLAKAFSC